MPDPPRLLVVTHEMTLSGAPIQLAYLVRWLRARGWEVTLVAPEPGPLSAELDGVEIIYEPQLLTDPQLEALRRLIPRCDGVIANTIATWQVVYAANEAHVPVIWYVHETEVGRELMKLIHMIEPMLESANALVVPTNATAQIYAPFRSRPIDLIPYGIPEVQTTPAERTSVLTCAVIGTYEPRKGQDVLLEAVRRLPPDLRVEFQLAGRELDAPFAAGLREWAKSLPNVKLLGALEHEQTLQLLAAADVLVCPSRDETMPIVVLEAMSLAKPIVCTDVGGISEWISDGGNGLLVPAVDPGALAHAIERLSSEAMLRQKLGAAARATFETHFTVDRYGHRFAEVIERTMSR